ncbi:MAG: hypothetical protein BMS9Abin13_616 [Patescibacteria group bacterium]|nr:MAG: hypothetical protein BMS9Abin13_616 [Patescibacteria group bacterium]
MSNGKIIEWVLRVGLAGTFIGHGRVSLVGNDEWVRWIMGATGWDVSLAAKALIAVGVLDVLVGAIILIKPWRIVVLWAVLWTSWTAFMHVLPFIGEPWELVEELLAPASALALLLLLGWPKSFKEWFK